MNAMKPGLNVRVVTDVDIWQETITVRSSTVFDATGERIVIAQTEPPLTRPGQEIVITYLIRENERSVRHGFPAQLVDSIDYFLSSGERVKALLLEKKGEPRPYSTRMFFRITPTPGSHLDMFIRGQKVTIVDISLRGARLSHERDFGLQTGETVTVSLDIGQRSYKFEARITRTWESADILLRRERTFASIEFLNLSAVAQRVLLHRLQQIERESPLGQ